MKTLKENKGITLIALIITIIILLILAAVTIMSLNGENGIIIKSRQAKSDYEKGQEKEKGILAKLESVLEGESGSEGETNSEIWQDNGDGTFLSSNGKTLKIGDILTNEEVLKLTGGTQSSYTGTWTVLGMKDGKLKLVSTDNVQEDVCLGRNDPKAIEALPNGTDLERGIWSYKNAVNTLNTVAQTATGITSAESIKIEDIYDIVGEENIDKGTEYYGKVYNYYYDTTNSKVYSKYKIGTDGNGNITWSTGTDTGYTSKTFVNDVGEKVVVDSAGDEVILTHTNFQYDFTNEQKEKLGSLATRYYWLASPCVDCDSYGAYFSVRSVHGGNIGNSLFISGGDAYSNYKGVCAVVYI